MQIKHTYIFLFVTVILLLAGAGCVSSQNSTSKTSPINTVQNIKYTPINASIINQAYIYCTKQKNQLVFRYDNATKKSLAYCQFPDNTECGALSYYQGSCNQGNGSKIRKVANNQPQNIRQCPTAEKPICGADGYTYTNSCIALLQHVAILHDGACTSKIIPQSTSGSSSGNHKTIPKTITKITKTQTGIPLWVNIAEGLSKSTNGNVLTVMDACSISSKQLYYQYQKCPTCFGILYTKVGTVVCYPNNDISNSCPANFHNDTLTSCKTIWTSR